MFDIKDDGWDVIKTSATNDGYDGVSDGYYIRTNDEGWVD